MEAAVDLDGVSGAGSMVIGVPEPGDINGEISS
jgi:hypothetical protein